MAIPDASIKGVGAVPEQQGMNATSSPGVLPAAQLSVPEHAVGQEVNKEASQDIASKAASGTPLAAMRESPPTAALAVLGTATGTVERPPSPSTMKRSDSMMKLGSLRGMQKITPKDVGEIQKSLKREMEDAKATLESLKEKAMPSKIPGLSLLHITSYASEKKTKELMQGLTEALDKYPQIASDAKFCHDFLSGLNPQAKKECYVALLSNKEISQDNLKALLSHEVNKDGIIKEIKNDTLKQYEKLDKKFGEVSKLEEDLRQKDMANRRVAAEKFGYDPTTRGANEAGDIEKFMELYNTVNKEDKSYQAIKTKIKDVAHEASQIGEQIGAQLGVEYLLNPESGLAHFQELSLKSSQSQGKMADESQAKFRAVLGSSLLAKLPTEMSQKLLGDYIRAEAKSPPPFRLTGSLTASLFGAAFRTEFGRISHQLIEQFRIRQEVDAKTLAAAAPEYMKFLATRLFTTNPTVNFLLKTIAAELKEQGTAYAVNVVFLRALCPELTEAGYVKLAAVLQGRASVDKFASSAELQAIGKILVSS